MITIIEGSACFKDARVLYNFGTSKILDQKNIKFDFSKIEKIDSSFLALLISWNKKAKKQDKKIVFYNASKILLDLAKVYGLDSILTFSHFLERE